MEPPLPALKTVGLVEEPRPTESFGTTANPLFYPPVFMEMSKYLSLADLKICRLVCKEWRDLSHQPLKKRARIPFPSQKAVRRFHEEGHEWSYLKNYRLCLNRRDTRTVQCFQEYLTPDGIEDLTVDCYQVLNPLLAFIEFNSSTLMNLSVRYANLGGVYSEPRPVPHTHREEMTTRFPKLRRIEVNQMPLKEFRLFSSILYSAPYLVEINCLDRYLTTAVWDHLDNWRWTLKSLKIGVINQQLSSTKRLLFPALPKLKKLEVMYWNFLHGIHNLTALEEFIVQRSNLELLFNIEDCHPVPTVKSLNIDDSYRLGLSLRSIPWLFTHLKTLHFPAMSNRTFRLVCLHLKTLEEIFLGASIVDSGVTGFVTNGFLPTIIEAAQDPLATPASLEENVFKHRRHPYIGDLPNLTHVTISSRKITDASILLGLIYCKRLTSVKIERPSISIVSLVLMADSLNLQNLHLHIFEPLMAAWVNAPELSYFLTKHPFCNLNIFTHKLPKRHFLTTETTSECEEHHRSL